MGVLTPCCPGACLSPSQIVSEVHRVMKPGGMAIFSFSNRCFFTKAINIWIRDMNDGPGHCRIVATYFKSVRPLRQRPKCSCPAWCTALGNAHGLTFDRESCWTDRGAWIRVQTLFCGAGAGGGGGGQPGTVPSPTDPRTPWPLDTKCHVYVQTSMRGKGCLLTICSANTPASLHWCAALHQIMRSFCTEVTTWCHHRREAADAPIVGGASTNVITLPSLPITTLAPCAFLVDVTIAIETGCPLPLPLYHHCPMVVPLCTDVSLSTGLSGC